MSERWSKLPWIEIGILLLAAVLRIALLDIKPPHFDEGINGWFADQMTRNGYYHYDPTNYHGPLHFYLVFLSQTLLGRSVWALRLPAIVASVLCVAMVLRYRVFFGATVARIAALAMAISPAYVFYGRYSIHESEMVLFLLLTAWGILGLWEKGERKYLFALITGVTGMILTKETYLLHVVSFALAGGVLWVWQKVIPSSVTPPRASQQWSRNDLIFGVVAAVVAVVFFYSGNFLDFSGLKGLYETFTAWVHTGVESAGHAKTGYQAVGPITLFGVTYGPYELPHLQTKEQTYYLNYYWVALMAQYEWPAFLGLVACFRYIGRADARLRYLAIYAGGVLLAYSLIPYKTPWCIISISWPFLLLFGALVVEAIEAFVQKGKCGLLIAYVFAPLAVASVGWRLPIVLRDYFNGKSASYSEPSTALIAHAVGVLVIAGLAVFLILRARKKREWLLGGTVGVILVFGFGVTLCLNFFDYTNEKEPYVYVQTYKEIENFTKPLLTMAKKDPTYYGKIGQIVLDSYYPIPWMLGDFTRLGYFSESSPPGTYDGDFILTLKSNEATVEPQLKDNYFRRELKIRDSQDACVAYFREKLFAPYFVGQQPEVKMLHNP